MNATSPLRYPGGKQVLTRVLSHLIEINGLQDGSYAEPYAGGAGAALSLLFGERIDRIELNDADPCIYAMWHSILFDTASFLSKLKSAKLTIAAWRRHRSIYREAQNHTLLDLGFSTFFLNRCNRSGIISNGGPIGGIEQTGRWKIDARFNRNTLARRIKKIAEYRDRISLSNLDALDFLRALAKKKDATKSFVYLDPPYYEKGRELYLNYYETSDHQLLANYLRQDVPFAWVLSYDNVKPIRSLYAGLRVAQFNLSYHAHTSRREGRELFVIKDGLKFPDRWRRNIPENWISIAEQKAA